MYNPKQLQPGFTHFTTFVSNITKKKMYQFDYRHTDGELFSTVKPTLAECEDAREEWINKKAGV